jgi:predicted transcriptional regulator
MRTLLEIPDELIHALDEICKQEDVSRVSLIRQAIADYLVARQSHQQAFQQGFGLLGFSRAGQGIEAQEMLKTHHAQEEALRAQNAALAAPVPSAAASGKPEIPVAPALAEEHAALESAPATPPADAAKPSRAEEQPTQAPMLAFTAPPIAADLWDVFMPPQEKRG